MDTDHSELDPTLQQQLQRAGIDPSGRAPIPARTVALLLGDVDETYRETKNSRASLERSLGRVHGQLAVANERLVQGEHARLDSVVGALDHGVMAVDARGRVLFVNRAAEVLIGGRPNTAAEMVQRLSPRGEHGEALSAEILLGRVIAGEHMMEVPCTLARYDDSTIEISASLTAITEGTEIVGRVLAFHDMTEHNKTLSQLAEALRAANVAVDVKSGFLANMSHEIRTPMNGVIGMMELLAGTALSDEQQQFVAIAKTSGEVLLDIINETLDFSKLEARKVQLEVAEFSPAAVAEDVAGLLAARAAENGLAVNVLVGTGVPRMALGDGGSVRQVLLNLVGNAVKFTDDGSINTQVERTVSTQSGSDTVQVRYRVIESGCAIPASRRLDIFSPFSQADASTTRTHGGTGLGLAISNQLVALMGGELTVQSEVGVGSTFAFAISVGEAPSGRGLVGPPMPKGLSVLVIGDADVDRRVAREYLQRVGS